MLRIKLVPRMIIIIRINTVFDIRRKANKYRSEMEVPLSFLFPIILILVLIPLLLLTLILIPTLRLRQRLALPTVGLKPYTKSLSQYHYHQKHVPRI